MGQMPEWLVMLMPIAFVLGGAKMLHGAASKPGRGLFGPWIAATAIGTWISALGLWSQNYVLTLPGHDPLRVNAYGAYLLGDLVVLALVWALICWGVVVHARAQQARKP